MAGPVPDLNDPQGPTAEEDAYFFRQIISHLHASADWPGIFELVESCPFLDDQVKFLGGFELAGRDLEKYAIPATLEVVDWNRFLHYASLALNLRGLAESLAEPEVLTALVRGGRQALARDTVGRIADPLRRAEARAVLAGARDPAEPVAQDLLREIEQELEAAIPNATTLAAIARHLGPELSRRWRSWIGRLPEGADTVWAAVAESWLDRGETHATNFWEALGEIHDRLLLQDFAGRLGEVDSGQAGETIERIAALLDDDPAARSLALARFLVGQFHRRPEIALAAWEGWTTREPITWTAELIDACRELLQSLSSAGVEAFFSTLDNPGARAALRIADLQARPNRSQTAAALEAVSCLPEGPAKLHWSLRYLEARPSEPFREVQGQVGAVAGYLHELRYNAPASDLRRFLDLVDRYYPNEVKRLVEDVAWSPASRAGTLLVIVAETTHERVAEQILENAERFASSVSLNEAEGFRLRGELIRRAACRLCLLRDDLRGLDIAKERILSEEEDELREMLAPLLAKAGRWQQALEVADGIQAPRSQFLTRLRILPLGEIPHDLLSPRSLYISVASAQSLEEESLALSSLLASPLDPQELARRWISPIRSGELQTQALLRLSRHALAFQRSFYGRRQDLTAALEVVRGSIAVETDERLAALTPEIAALGAEAGSREAVNEFQEAARRLAEIDTVPWALRAHGLEHLLSLIGPCFLSHPRGQRRDIRRALAVLEFIARLPLGPTPSPALAELRSRWHEILPILIALTDRFPSLMGKSLDRALDQGMSACGAVGGETVKKVFSLCSAPGTERLRLAELAVADASDPALLQGLAYLFGVSAPEWIPDALRPLRQETRDNLVLRLVRFRWVAPEKVDSLLSLITDSAARKEVDVWLRLDGPDWPEDLAMLAFLRTVDPSQPDLEEILHHLWKSDPNRSRPALARAFVNALSLGGRERGEAILRLWLHAHLTPVFGIEQAEALERSEEVRGALKRSLVLSP